MGRSAQLEDMTSGSRLTWLGVVRRHTAASDGVFTLHCMGSLNSSSYIEFSAWDRIALWAVVFILKTTVIYSLGHGLRVHLFAVPRSTQPSTLRGSGK